MTDKELLQQALEALEEMSGGYCGNLIDSLRDRLAREEPTCEYCGGDRFIQPARQEQEQEPQHTKKYVTQEPVAWVERDGELVWNNREAAIGRNLYTAPPARQWQGLSEEEIALLEWAVSTLGDFSASDRSRPAWQFVYMPKLADLRNVVEQHKAKLREGNT